MSLCRAFALLTLSACASSAAQPPVVEVVPAEVSFASQRTADRAPDPVRPGVDGRTSVTVAATLGESPEPAPEEILAELERNAGHLQRCWEARADRVAGDIVIHAHVGPDGAVHGQCVSEDTVGDPEVVRCANDVIAMGRYPASEAGTVDVTILFRLTPPKYAELPTAVRDFVEYRIPVGSTAVCPAGGPT